MNIKRILRNAFLDLKYGGFLGGTKKTPYTDLGAHDTANTGYSVLPYLFKNMISPSDVLVDVGCGKGRVINWWLNEGYKNQIIGIELDKEVAHQTRQRLSKYRNVTIIDRPFTEEILQSGTVFYLFNPFSKSVMEKFKAAIENTVAVKKRTIKVIYYNCLDIEVFMDDPGWVAENIYIPDDCHQFHHKAVLLTIK